MAQYNGTKLKILQNGIVIDDLSEVTMTVDGEMIEVTNKDSAGWSEFLPGKRKVTMSGTADLDSTSTLPASDIFAKISAGTLCAVIFYHTVTGQKSYTGSGYYTKFEQKGGTEDRMQISFDIQMTGTVVQIATT